MLNIGRCFGACRYTIGSNSARSCGGSKCVHLPLPISNVLTTRLFASTKQIVRESGCCARASAAARSSSRSRRRATVRFIVPPRVPRDQSESSR